MDPNFKSQSCRSLAFLRSFEQAYDIYLHILHVYSAGFFSHGKLWFFFHMFFSETRSIFFDLFDEELISTEKNPCEASSIPQSSHYSYLFITWYTHASLVTIDHVYITTWKKLHHLGNSSWLVVYLPLWKIWKSVRIIIPNIWKQQKMLQTTNQLENLFQTRFKAVSGWFPLQLGSTNHQLARNNLPGIMFSLW
jgi:hypothetical protein